MLGGKIDITANKPQTGLNKAKTLANTDQNMASTLLPAGARASAFCSQTLGSKLYHYAEKDPEKDVPV